MSKPQDVAAELQKLQKEVEETNARIEQIRQQFGQKALYADAPKVALPSPLSSRCKRPVAKALRLPPRSFSTPQAVRPPSAKFRTPSAQAKTPSAREEEKVINFDDEDVDADAVDDWFGPNPRGDNTF